MVDVSCEQKAKEARKGELSDDDLIHIYFVILVSMISFWFTQRLKSAVAVSHPLE